MNYGKYAALALSSSAIIALLYALKPPYDELALNNAALAAQISNEESQANQVAPELTLGKPCFDESLRALSCNDLLVAQAATGHVVP